MSNEEIFYNLTHSPQGVFQTLNPHPVDKKLLQYTVATQASPEIGLGTGTKMLCKLHKK